MSETKVIALKCPGCGAKLDISADMDQFACGYCGSELFIQRKGGTIALKPVTDAIKQVQVGTDKTAAELALQRYQNELEQLRKAKAEMQAAANKRIQTLTQAIDYHSNRTKNGSGNDVVILIIVFFVALYIFAAIFGSNSSTSVISLPLAIVTAIAVLIVIRKGRSSDYKRATEPLEAEITSIQEKTRSAVSKCAGEEAEMKAKMEQKRRIADA